MIYHFILSLLLLSAAIAITKTTTQAFNEENNTEIETAEEVNDVLYANELISAQQSKEIEDFGPLLPDLEPIDRPDKEPNYEEMDNLTLLSTLCLDDIQNQDAAIEGTLLPNFD